MGSLLNLSSRIIDIGKSTPVLTLWRSSDFYRHYVDDLGFSFVYRYWCSFIWEARLELCRAPIPLFLIDKVSNWKNFLGQL